jgi:hypothetical protein
MPFIFSCSQCGHVLYEDPNPLLQYGFYKSPTYLERVLIKLGITCPSCGHQLHVPPLRIEILAPTNGNSAIEKPRKRKVPHHTKSRRWLSLENREAHSECEPERSKCLILLSATAQAHTNPADTQRQAKRKTDVTLP